VKVVTPSGEEQEIGFDYLFICTGSQYSEPIKDFSAQTLANRKSNLAFEVQAVQKAKSVLVVGAGAVGVELAAELKHFNPDKKIGIVSRQNRLLPTF